MRQINNSYNEIENNTASNSIEFLIYNCFEGKIREGQGKEREREDGKRKTTREFSKIMNDYVITMLHHCFFTFLK